jgi:hypothetical protein
MMGKKSGSGTINQDHISESFENNFKVKILNFFDVDPGSGGKKFGSGMEKIRMRDKHPESAALLSQRKIFLCRQLYELPTNISYPLGPWRAGHPTHRLSPL